MYIFPAIDIFEGKAVRLIRGDYNQMTVYSDNPPAKAKEIAAEGASHLHIVDLEGALKGTTSNIETVRAIAAATDMFTELGGGIRSLSTIETYLDAGIDRVILGTAAVTDEKFLKDAVSQFGSHVAVGIDIKNGKVAVKGWTETTSLDAMEFCKKAEQLGVTTVICTDISRDGVLQGSNHILYREMSEVLGMQIIASGGVTDITDIENLSRLNLYGAIIGKAYYSGTISLKEAIKVAE